MVAFCHQGRIDHDHVRHRVQGLDDLRLGEGPLNLLAERIRVAHSQRGWHSLREVERIRNVDQDLAGEVSFARGAQRLERGRSRRGVDEDFSVCRRVRKGDELGLRVRLDPRVEWWITHVIRLRFGHCFRDVACAEDHLMAEFHEFAANRSSDRTRSQDTDFQRYAPRPPDDPGVFVGFRWKRGPYLLGERDRPGFERHRRAVWPNMLTIAPEEPLTDSLAFADLLHPLDLALNDLGLADVAAGIEAPGDKGQALFRD